MALTLLASFPFSDVPRAVATHGFLAPPDTVLTPLIPLLLNKVTGPSKFYKFVRFKKPETPQTIHTLFEITFLWYPYGDSWVRNAFSVLSKLSFCYWKKLSAAWLCSAWINCLDYSSKINEKCHGFMLFSIDSVLHILTKWQLCQPQMENLLKCLKLLKSQNQTQNTEQLTCEPLGPLLWSHSECPMSWKTKKSTGKWQIALIGFD